MNMLPTTSHPQDAGRTDGHVDQIRDILFGGQMREYEHRFAQMEDRMVAEHERLRVEGQEQLRVLKDQLASALRQLAEQTQAENSQRANTAQELAKEMRASVENLGRELQAANERGEQRHRELAEQLKGAEETARREREELAARIDQQLKHLAATVAERGAVADLLSEMAGRLRGPAAS